MRALLVLVLAACASSPREAIPERAPQIPEPATTRVAAAVDPVGEFEYSTMTPDGTPLSGVITVRGTPGSYTGGIDAGAMGVFPIKGVTVAGQTMTIAAEHPEGPIEVRLTLVGDEFTGSWHLGTDTGEIAGKRKR